MIVLEFSEILEQVVQIYKNGFMHALAWCIFFNFFTEVLKSFKTKEKISSISLYGVSKYILVILVMFVLNVYLPLFGFAIYAQGLTLWMIITYLITLTENWRQLGLPLPDTLKEFLIKLKKTNEKNMYIDINGSKVEGKDGKEEDE